MFVPALSTGRRRKLSQLHLHVCSWSDTSSYSNCARPMAREAKANMAATAAQILNEIQAVFEASDSDQNANANADAVQVMLGELLACRSGGGSVVLHGVGREGLMMKALAMRLFHLGFPRVHCVGDMTAPPVAEKDLLMVSAGPGTFSTIDALCQVAKSAGARVLLVTAQSQGSAVRLADAVALLPAQTMADDLGGTLAGSTAGGTSKQTSILPMGSLYEGAMYVLFEIVVLELRKALGESVESMRARHTNLE